MIGWNIKIISTNMKITIFLISAVLDLVSKFERHPRTTAMLVTVCVGDLFVILMRDFVH